MRNSALQRDYILLRNGNVDLASTATLNDCFRKTRLQKCKKKKKKKRRRKGRAVVFFIFFNCLTFTFPVVSCLMGRNSSYVEASTFFFFPFFTAVIFQRLLTCPLSICPLSTSVPFVFVSHAYFSHIFTHLFLSLPPPTR